MKKYLAVLLLFPLLILLSGCLDPALVLLISCRFFQRRTPPSKIPKSSQKSFNAIPREIYLLHSEKSRLTENSGRSIKIYPS